MTHEKIHTIHLTPHITWQGTRAELEAMQAEGWPLVEARAERIKELLAEARAERIKELEAKLAKAVEALVQIVGKKYYADDPWGIARATLAALKGQGDEG
jgi:L-lactate utilization protein LutB